MTVFISDNVSSKIKTSLDSISTKSNRWTLAEKNSKAMEQMDTRWVLVVGWDELAGKLDGRVSHKMSEVVLVHEA